MQVLDELHSAGILERQVDYRQLWRGLFHRLDCPGPIFRGRAHRQVRLTVDELGKTVTHYGVVVHQKNSGGLVLAGFQRRNHTGPFARLPGTQQETTVPPSPESQWNVPPM